MAPVSSKEFLEIQANYRVWIHSEPPTWHANNIQYVISCDYDFRFDAKLKCDFVLNSHFRSCQQRFSARNGVLRNFAKFTGKHLCQSPAILLQKRLWHSCFPVNFIKFLRTAFFIEHLWWLLQAIRFLNIFIRHSLESLHVLMLWMLTAWASL